MQHCVGAYAPYCRGGVRRVYSVRERKSGRRVATFSVEYVDYGDGHLCWECDQLSGFKNAEVLPPEVIVAADAVLRTFLELPAQTFAKPVLPSQVTMEDFEYEDEEE